MQKKLVAVLAAAIFMAVPALGIAALAGPNTVNSAAIIDGSVATADIANLAVTTANIANLAVTTAKIANGAVTATNLATNAVANGNLSNGSVTTSKIADGAVTDAKITGLISANKIQANVFQKKYANVVIVAKSGGDFTDPISAINSISNASSANPYIVQIMPGVYDIGRNSLTMKDYIDIEGTGVNSTVISGSGHDDSGMFSSGLVIGASNAEMRSLTILDYDAGTAPLSTAVFNTGVSPTFSNVKIISDSHGNKRGMVNTLSSPTLNNVTFTATILNDPFLYSVEAMQNYLASVVMNNVNISADIGIANQASTVTGKNIYIAAKCYAVMGGGTVLTESKITKTNADICPNGPDTPVLSGGAVLFNSQIDSQVKGDGTCINTVDGNWNLLSNSCQ